MPVVDIEGIGTAEFPDSATPEQMTEAVNRYAKPLIARREAEFGLEVMGRVVGALKSPASMAASQAGQAQIDRDNQRAFGGPSAEDLAVQERLKQSLEGLGHGGDESFKDLAFGPFIAIPRAEWDDPKFFGYLAPIIGHVPNETESKIAAGAFNLGKGLIEAVESPAGLVTLALGGAPAWAQKLVALGYAVAGVKGGAEKMGQASVTDNLQTWVEGGGEGAMGLAIGAGVGGLPKVVRDIVRERQATALAPATTEALKETTGQPLTEKGPTDAIRQPIPNESVLRETRPEVELQEMGKPYTEPETPAATQEPETSAQPSEEIAPSRESNFLGQPVSIWTEERIDGLSPENRRGVIRNGMDMLKELGGKTKLQANAKTETIIKAIREIGALREAEARTEAAKPVETSNQSTDQAVGQEGAQGPGLQPAGGEQGRAAEVAVGAKPVPDAQGQAQASALAPTAESASPATAGAPTPAPPALAETTAKAGETQSELRFQMTVPGAHQVGAFVQNAWQRVNQARQGFVNALRSSTNKKLIDQTYDAANNRSAILGEQARHSLELGATKLERQAAYAVIEANGDPANLATFLAKIGNRNPEARAAVLHAQANWAALQPLATKVKGILDAQIAAEHSAGIETEYTEAYVPHIYDMDLLMGQGRPVVLAGGGRGQLATGFKKGRTFENIFDAIEQGYTPKSLDVAAAVEHRVRAGQQLINRKAWGEAFKAIPDPTDGRPVATDIQTVRRPNGTSYQTVPLGYRRQTIIPGHDVAIHEEYAPLFNALLSESRISASRVGRAALQAEGAIKHGMLVFDTYHVSKMTMRQLFLSRHIGYRKGLSLLEYADHDLNEAVAQGEITPAMARWAQANRADANLLVRSGLNVGRVSEALYTSFARKIPIIGTFNKWVFEKLTRGIILESALRELPRIQDQLGLTRSQAALKVARDLNAYFGNLQSQGVFKSKTFQDMSQLVALAPRWVESMVRTEAGALVKGVADPIRYRKLAVSSIPLAMASGLGAMYVAAQVVNMLSKGHPTWQNEKGHKFDAWIPGWGKESKGFWFSPLSIPAEIAHDLFHYAKQEGDVWKGAVQVMSNKASPLFRALSTLFSGRVNGQKLVGKQRFYAAGANLIPTPIPLSPIAAPFRERLGMPASTRPQADQWQRQTLSSLGVKVEPAQSNSEKVYQMARKWMASSPNEKVKEKFMRAESEDRAPSLYRPLRLALTQNDTTKAMEAYESLLRTHKASAIREAMRAEVQGKGQFAELDTHPKRFAGMTESEERAFKKSLSPEELATFEAAQKDRKDLFKRFNAMLRERANRPAKSKIKTEA